MPGRNNLSERAPKSPGGLRRILGALPSASRFALRFPGTCPSGEVGGHALALAFELRSLVLCDGARTG
jgi:hypothetical protein